VSKSPFYHGIQNGTIYLEDFEDQELNTPLVVVPSDFGFFGTTSRAYLPDSTFGAIWNVDGDDGRLDGNGFGGDSWIGITRCCFTVSTQMQFDFLPDDQGRYPTYVGLVINGAADFDRTVDLGVGLLTKRRRGRNH